MFTEQSLSKDISENNLNIKNNGLPLIAIPTTAGTGSESTQFSVIYINKRKYSIDDPKLLPNFVILDSSFLNGSPTELIATTGMDALTQSIESLWSVNSTEQSRGYATEAIKIIRDTLEEAYISGYDSGDSGEVMLKAANLSGKAINITRTTAPHAISYPLTIHFKIPHGHAVALTLSKFFEINSQTNKYKINDLRGKTHVDSIMKYIFSLFLASSAKECSKNFNKLMDTIGLERNFNKLGIESKADIKKITDNIDPNRIKNNPVEIDKKTVENIFNN
jgi:alcohol dehydrogenase class IV